MGLEMGTPPRSQSQSPVRTPRTLGASSPLATSAIGTPVPTLTPTSAPAPNAKAKSLSLEGKTSFERKQTQGSRASLDRKRSYSFAAAQDDKVEVGSGGSLSVWWILQDTADVEFDPQAEDEAAEAGNDTSNQSIVKAQLPFLVFHPWSRPRIIWDLLVMVLLIYNLLIIPFNLAFKDTQPEKFLETDDTEFWVEFGIDCFFLADIVLNFMTAYVTVNEKGDSELVVKRTSIAAAYLQGWFIIDFIGAVPLTMILRLFSNEDSGQTRFTRILRVFKILRLLKITRVLRLGRFIKKLKDAFDFNPAVIRAIKMLTFFCLVAHALTCLLFYIGTLRNDFQTCVPKGEEKLCTNKVCFSELDSCMCNTETSTNPDDPTQKCIPSTWLTESYFMMPGQPSDPDYEYKLEHNMTGTQRVIDMPIGEQYQITLYWVLSTMATVGFGDLQPVTQYEIGVCIVSQIVGATTFGFIVGNMATLAELLKGRTGEFKEAIEDITNLLSAFGVPARVKRRVVRDFNHQFRRPYAEVKSTIIDVVPRALGVLVSKDIYRDILEQTPLFRTLPAVIRDSLYLKLQPRHFSPGEDVLRKDQVPTGILIILSGLIHISEDPRGEQQAGEMQREMSEAGLDTVQRDSLDQRAIYERLSSEGKILVTLMSGSILGEECLLPSTPPFQLCAKADEWLDVLYLDRRDLLSILADSPEHQARVHLTARIRNERFRTLVGATRCLAARNHADASTHSHPPPSPEAAPARRGVVPPLNTEPELKKKKSKKERSRDLLTDTLGGAEGKARAARMRADPNQLLSVGGVPIKDFDLSEVDKARLAQAVTDHGEEGGGVTEWSEWMDGQGLDGGVQELAQHVGSCEKALAYFDEADGANGQTLDSHMALPDLPALDEEGNPNEAQIEKRLQELIQRLDRLEEAGQRLKEELPRNL